MKLQYPLLGALVLISFFAKSQVYFEKLYPNLNLQSQGTMDISPSDNGYIFCGTQSDDYFVLKADSSGLTQWMNRYDSLGAVEICSAICHLSDGKFAFIGNGKYLTNNDDIAVAGILNSTGDSLHFDNYPVHDEGWGTFGIAISPDTSGSYHTIIGEDGLTAANYIYLDYNTIIGDDGSNSSASSLSTNSHGTTYAFTFGGVYWWPRQNVTRVRSNLGLDTAYDDRQSVRIRACEDDGFFLVTSTYNYSTATHDTSTLFKYDQNGNLLWSHYYFGNPSLDLRDVAEHPNGNLYLLFTDGTVGNQRIELMVTTPTGDSIWSHFFYGYGTAGGKDLKIYPNGDFIIYGSSTGDPYIIKADSLAQINPNFSITGNGHLFCDGDTAILTVNAANSYLWSTGDTTQTITVTSTTIATVTVTDNLGNSSVTANYPVVFNHPPSALISSLDTIYACSGFFISDSAAIDPYQNYTWLIDSTVVSHSSSTYVSNSGMLQLVVSNNCGSNTDSVYVLIAPYQPSPYVSVSPDINLCKGDSVLLVAGGSAYPYVWFYDQDTTYLSGFSGDSIYANRPGSYRVQYMGLYNCPSGSYYFSLLDRMPDSTVIYSGSTSLCTGDSIQLSGADIGPQFSYLWSNGNTTSFIYPQTAGCYSFHISNIWGCSANSDTVCLNFVGTSVNLGPDTTYCINSNYTLDAGNGFSTYLWQDSTLNSTLLIFSAAPDTAFYSVIVTDTSGCPSTDSVQVIFEICSAIREFSDDKFRVFPNPASDIFMVEINQPANEEGELHLIDHAGKTVIYQLTNRNSRRYEFTIDKLPAGVYSIVYKTGTEILTKKLVLIK